MNSRRPTLSPHDEAIEAMAAAWLAQRDDGLPVEDRLGFECWCAADPRHAAAVARLERAWAALQQLREFRPESQVHPDRDVLVQHRQAGRNLSFPAVAAGAGLAAALAIGALLWLNRPVEATGTSLTPVYATTTDGYQRVTLEDGSVLELNARSLVRVIYTPGVRRVLLVHGEAHFTVAHNKERPFVVEAGPLAVRAVGTAFNVRLGEGDVEVLVTEGRVKVRNHGAPVPPAADIPELGVGQRLLVTATVPGAEPPPPPVVERLAPEVVQESLAWQGPRLRFVDTPLASVVAQFNRRNQLQVELGEAGLVSVPVDGSFRAENVEAFVRLLESNGSIKAERISPDRIVLRRAHGPQPATK